MIFKQIFKNYYKTIIWSIVMCYLLFSPASALPKNNIFSIPYFDKVVHFFMFAILTYIYLSETNQKQLKIKMLLLFIVVSISAVSSELIQAYFIPGRSGNIRDFIADITGFLFGLAAFLIKKFYIQKKLSAT